VLADGHDSQASVLEYAVPRRISVSWCGMAHGLGIGRAIKRSTVGLLIGAQLRNDSGQVVHTVVTEAPGSIIQYRLTGGDLCNWEGNRGGLASN